MENIDYKKYIPVWDKLDDSQRKKLSDASTFRRLKKGEFLHNGSEKCTGIVLVISGQLRAYTASNDGREITLYRLFERDICLFSAFCMMNSLQFDIIISVEKDAEVVIISPNVYKSVMEVCAPLANYTNEIMASRISDIMWLVESIMWKSFDKRLAEFLINESNIEQTDMLKITHETIGNHLGSPREVVTRMLKYFSDKNIVKLSRGSIELTDKNKLQKIIDE